MMMRMVTVMKIASVSMTMPGPMAMRTALMSLVAWAIKSPVFVSIK